MPPETAIFLSDAHLGAESKEREASRSALLHEFLDSLPGRATSLYVVGDLFDFWFEYRSTIPRRHFHTLAALERVRRAGIPVTYLGGNHDFWLGSFLTDELGILVHEGALALETQGRRLWIHHGDGLIGGDIGYKVLKKVLRNPAAIAAYRLLHPDLGIPLASWVSGKSRHSRDRRTLDGDRLVREIARPRFVEGFDAVMVGHFHHAFEHHEDGKDFFVLGDWIERFTYVVLEEGRLSLQRWPESRSSPQKLAVNENR
jgi:UDP-2,3-diacylglucosamine hydrolase